MDASLTLRIEATWQGDRIAALSVANPRPPAARLLVGRSVAEALALVPALFGLCARAQTAATRAACRVASGERAARSMATDEERALTAEMAREHLWRLLLDWPPLFGHEPRREGFAPLYRILGEAARDSDAGRAAGTALDALVNGELTAGRWPAMSTAERLDDLLEQARRGGLIGAILAELIERELSTPYATPLLPMQAARARTRWLGSLPKPAFCRAPTFQGRACETGPLARQVAAAPIRGLLARGQRIAARVLARLFDLADCARRLCRPGAAPPLLDAALLGDRCGLACVETARGVLLHAVRLADGRITDYAIVAPTEWHFHPAGPFVREGRGGHVGSRDTARRYVQALVLALDPCIDYMIEWREPDHA